MNIKTNWLVFACLALTAIGGILTIYFRYQGIVFLSVRSGSMQPTICSGDLIAIRRVAGEYLGLGQIILHGGPDGDLLVKRVVGMPGDNITFSLDNVKRNGKSVTSSFSCASTSVEDENFDFAMTVPVDSVFAIGDNLLASVDSRSHGSVPLSAVAGTLIGHVPLSRCECNDISHTGEQN